LKYPSKNTTHIENFRDVKNMKMTQIMTVCLVLLSGCSSVINPIESSPATVGYNTQVSQELCELPPPKEKIIISVYKFRDQTGQYKPGGTVMTYSTAVTQGATSLLMKALQDAGCGTWFTVVEREMLSDLVNERKLIYQTREQYKATNLPPIPPLLYSPLILEGGIIAYESNLLTGGAGARYLGIGGDTEFQRDAVTVYLRAVAVQNGEVLKNITTRKTIFSLKLDLSTFKYLAFKSLLEAEVGVTSNEPPQMAVLEAIEKSVYGLIVEGVISGLWSFKEPDKAKEIIATYVKNSETKVSPKIINLAPDSNKTIK